MEMLKCQVVDCQLEGKETWLLKTEAGMIERFFCYAHALDYRINDKAAFGDNYVPGSDEGEL